MRLFAHFASVLYFNLYKICAAIIMHSDWCSFFECCYDALCYWLSIVCLHTTTSPADQPAPSCVVNYNCAGLVAYLLLRSESDSDYDSYKSAQQIIRAVAVVLVFSSFTLSSNLLSRELAQLDCRYPCTPLHVWLICRVLCQLPGCKFWLEAPV